MIFSKAFRDFMATGKKPTEAIAEDAAPKGEDGKSVDLKAHDARFHGGHYDGKGECKYREALAKGDDADKIANAEREEEKAVGKKYVPTDAEIDEAAKKVNEAYDFDIDGVKDNIKTLLDGKKVYGNANGNLFDIINANRGGGVVRAIRDRAEEQGLDDSWVKKLNEYVEGKENKEKAENASPQDYADLEDIRQKVEAAARLLNGRAGNLQALQASRRWPLLNSITADAQLAADVARLQKSADKAVSGQANDLAKILTDIAAQKRNGWAQGVGMVPAALNGPQGAAPGTKHKVHRRRRQGDPRARREVDQPSHRHRRLHAERGGGRQVPGGEGGHRRAQRPAARPVLPRDRRLARGWQPEEGQQGPCAVAGVAAGARAADARWRSRRSSGFAHGRNGRRSRRRTRRRWCGAERAGEEGTVVREDADSVYGTVGV